jgi:pimeloyl-ACP methyl ester carboxylesterase
VTPVWLHGWPLDETMWQREVERFGGVAVRLYGRGASIDAWAEQLLAELDGDDLALIGSSMGGYTALAMTRLAPARVSALVLSASKAAADPPERKAFRDRLIAELRESGPPPHAVPGVGVEELVAAQEAIRDRSDTTDVVRGFGGVFVACAGTRDDVVTPQEARELAALAPNGRAELFDAEHFINLDDPEGFAAMLETVL